jgi:hypothetical protein
LHDSNPPAEEVNGMKVMPALSIEQNSVVVIDTPEFSKLTKGEAEVLDALEGFLRDRFVFLNFNVCVRDANILNS